MRDSLDAVAGAARAWLPRPLFGFARRLGTALLTPLLFSVRTGHFRSSLLGRAVNRSGAPIPWYTYPALCFLDGKDFTGRRVLEFGAGQSTLWWASRGARVTSFEDDPRWIQRLQTALPSGAKLHYVAADLNGIQPFLAPEPFHVIVIDGLNRLKCAELAVTLLDPAGAIILDNSEGYWGGDLDQTHPILDFLHGRGFQRIDFFGYAPGVIRPHCTSLFWRGCCFLLEGTEPPSRGFAGL